MSPCSRHHENLALLASGDLLAEDASSLDAHLALCAECTALAGDLAADQALFAAAARSPETQPIEPLAPAVLARVAAETMADGLFRQPPTPSRRAPFGKLTAGGLASFGRVAAACLLVAAAGTLGYALLHADPSGEGGLVAEGANGAVQTIGQANGAATAADAADAVAGPVEPPAHPVASAAGGQPPVLVASMASHAEGAGHAPVATENSRPVRVRRAGGPAVALDWDGDGREASEVAASPYKVLASASARDFSEARPVLVAGRSLVAGLDLPSLRTSDRAVTFFRVE